MKETKNPWYKPITHPAYNKKPFKKEGVSIYNVEACIIAENSVNY